MLDHKGHIVFLGNGICDLHQYFKEKESIKILLNDINPLFPLLSLPIAQVSGDTLTQYEVIGGSALEMEYEENSLSKIYAGYLLKYLSPVEIEKIFQDVGIGLKKGGRFYIDEFSESVLKEMIGKKAKQPSEVFSLDFSSYMKSQPSMEFLIAVAAKNQLKCIYEASGDHPQSLLSEEPFIHAKVKSYHLIFEKVS